LPCFVIFALNYASVSFDFSFKANCFEIEKNRLPPPFMEMSGSVSDIDLDI
jgi:hypothetical protein